MLSVVIVNADCSLTEIGNKALFKCWQHHVTGFVGFFSKCKAFSLALFQASLPLPVWLPCGYLNDMQNNTYWS